MIKSIRILILGITISLFSVGTGFTAWTMSPYAYELSSEPIVHQTEDMLKVALMNYISQNYRSEILHDKMLELEELVCPLSIFGVSDRLQLDSSLSLDERKSIIEKHLLFPMDDIRTYIIDWLCMYSINIHPEEGEVLSEDDIYFIKYEFPDICELGYRLRLCI